MQEEENLSFETHDLLLVAALKLEGYEPASTVRVRRPEARTDLVVYVYDRTEALEDVVSDFSLGDLRFEPKTLFEGWRSIRQAVDKALGKSRR